MGAWIERIDDLELGKAYQGKENWEQRREHFLSGEYSETAV